MKYDVIIVGGGASGMLSSIILAKQELKVAIVEKNNKLGKKLLATGNGRCNFTNRLMSEHQYYTDSSEFVGNILHLFNEQDVLDLFRELGVIHREKDGYCYPYSNQSKTIVEVLKSRLHEYGVTVFQDEKCTSIVKKDCFYVQTSNQKLEAKYVMLACGSKASPELGGDGSGYQLARRLGHAVTPLYPALTGLVCVDNPFDSMSGVRFFGEVKLFVDGQCVAKEQGEIQCTKDGISGIPVFQLCRVAAVALGEEKHVEGLVDFIPTMTLGECEEYIDEQLDSGQNAVDVLRGIVNDRCIGAITEQCGDNPDASTLAHGLKEYSFMVRETAGFDKAQAVAGGIPLEEMTDSLESALCENLYILGEMLDVDGICGGYNLQWAWSTAVIASHSIMEKER